MENFVYICAKFYHIIYMIGSLRRFFGKPDEASFDDIDMAETEVLQPLVPLSSAPNSDIPAELLNPILTLINSSLPPIIKDSLDLERQRTQLATLLGPALTDYAAAMRRQALQDLTGSKAQMQRELDDLRNQRKELAAKRESQKAEMLSEQRQRRAAQERNRDLENRIEELASEIEQHKLTISGLSNKLRMADMADADVAALRDELAQARLQIEALQQQAAQPQEPSNAEDVAVLQAKLHSITIKASGLEDKLQQMNELNETYQSEIEARSREMRQQSTELETALKEASELPTLKARLAELQQEDEGLKAKLNSALQEIEDLKAQLADNPLEASLMQRQEMIAAEGEPQQPKKSRRGRPRAKVTTPQTDMTAELGDLEGIDWLLPGGNPESATTQAGSADHDFGYQPPKRLPDPNPDTQLTLF